MQLHTDVYAYELTWEHDEPLGVQIVETDEATILFGSGTEETVAEVHGIVADHDVDVIIVEHGDYDHYDGVPALRESFPDVTVAIPAGDAYILEDEDIDIDRQLEAGRRYWGIQTISTPGHSPDNMSYQYEDVLIAGDTVIGADSIFAAADDWSGELAVIQPQFSVDDEKMRKSVPILLDYNFDTVLVSHGSNLETGGHDAVETLVEDLS